MRQEMQRTDLDDMADASKHLDDVSGLKIPDYIELSEELGTKIEKEGYKIINIEDAAQANAD